MVQLSPGDFMFKKKKRRSRQFKSNGQVIDIEDARIERKQRRDAVAEKKVQGRKPSKPKMTERKAGQKARLRIVYFAVFLGVVIFVGVSVFNIVCLKITEAKTIEEQKELLYRKEKLETELSQVNSPEYIEQQARQQLKMIKPGEILYVLPQEPESKAVVGTPKEKE